MKSKKRLTQWGSIKGSVTDQKDDRSAEKEEKQDNNAGTDETWVLTARTEEDKGNQTNNNIFKVKENKHQLNQFNSLKP